jgi:hypothetical protein
MRGFIEVHQRPDQIGEPKEDTQYAMRMEDVKSFGNGYIRTRHNSVIESHDGATIREAPVIYVKETYEELKALIEEAQKEDYPKRIVHAGGSINTLPQKERQERMADSLARLTSVSIPHEFFNHEADCDFCEGGAIRFALKRGGHADDWFDYSRQLTVEDGIINVAMTREDGTEGENIIFEGISYCPFCGRAFQEITKDDL